jgi:EAL domain-containing protein (putative c-di-GMP-specific phosphodiesterase class I)
MIQNRDDEVCLVNAIVSMAQGLKMDIIAEGVESKAQLGYLQQLGCTVVQGFLFGHATRLESMADQFNQNPQLLMEPELH